MESKRYTSRLREFLALSFMIVPIVALVSANFYFEILAGEIDILRSNYFTLNDHFDKAIDFLLPIFGFFGFLVGAELLFSDIRGRTKLLELGEDPKSTIWGMPSAIYPFWKILFWFGLSFFLVLALPSEMLGIALLPTLFGFRDPMVWMAVDWLELHLGWDRNKIKLPISVAILYIGSCVCLIITNAHKNISHAKNINFQTSELGLVEASELGMIVFDKGAFSIMQSDGSILLKGEAVEPKSRSALCRWEVPYSCITTFSYNTEPTGPHPKKSVRP